MDGLRGDDPDPKLTGSEEYDDAWLVGAADREKGVKHTSFLAVKVSLKLKGKEITIPKGIMVQRLGRPPKPAGTTYRVKVDHILHCCPAFWDFHAGRDRKELIRPKPTAVCWAGAGGYWVEASINDVILPEADLT